MRKASIVALIVALLASVGWFVTRPGWDSGVASLAAIAALIVALATTQGGKGGSAIDAGKGSKVSLANSGRVTAGAGGSGGSGGDAIRVGPGVTLNIHNTGVIAGGDAGGALLERATSRSNAAARLSAFLREAQALRERRGETPLPISDHNAWVANVEDYLLRNLGSQYAVTFSDFSGMQFFGDGSEMSRYDRSLDGRSRRLHEFIQELNR